MATDPEIQDLQAIRISVAPLWDEMSCPICFNFMDECGMLPCGHHLCVDCATECLNREHICPCCRAPATKEQLIPDRHLNKLAAMLKKAKEEEEKAYFEHLISGAVQDTHDASVPIAPKHEPSPVELVFQQQLQKSLRAYQDYYDQQRLEFEQAKHRILSKAHDDVNAMRRRNEVSETPDDGLDAKCSAVMQAAEKAVETVEARFQDSIRLLLSNYEAYVAGTAPDPRIMPVVVSIAIPSKEFVFHEVKLEPGCTINELQQILRACFEQRDDSIVEFATSNLFVLCRAHEPTSSSGMPSPEGITRGVLLQEGLPLISHYEVTNGCTIALCGDLHLKSDDPVECFAVLYQADTDQLQDYYTCNDCGVNWICTNCALNCHKGHNIVEYVMDHKPTWACCYCRKKGKCILRPKKK